MTEKCVFSLDSLCKDSAENVPCTVGTLHLNNTEWIPKNVCGSRSSVTRCPPSPYRTADGSCNNLLHPDIWGVAMKPFRRVLPPEYADGISRPRASGERGLPTAREVSLNVHRAVYVKDVDFTVMLAVWGQFIDHDITSTALSQGVRGRPITCCNPGKDHPECFVVRLGPEDPLYREHNVTCMEFVRSAPAPTCAFGPREHLNQASSFLDGSAIYGNSDQLMKRLRSFRNGELQMLTTPTGEELLPVSKDVADGCNREEELERGRYCFLTGDTRTNENLHLTSMHLIFARQHNAIARKLSWVNPHWRDERIFGEARRIVVAQLQHITYNEFLPSILPPSLMQFLNLTARPAGYFEGYDESVDPTVANSFAASVFRFGHSLLPGLMKMIANDSSTEEYVELHKMLFNPFGLYDRDFLEKIVRGALDTATEKNDVYFTKEVTANLFRKPENKIKKTGKKKIGLDLVSLNIQRGRDHGLAGYPKWRSHCGLSKVASFDELRAIFDPDSLDKVKTLYRSVDDIDLFTGGLAEIPVEGGLLGPTFTCLLADQFLRLKVGDRFWYETGQEPQAFTQDQLRELRKTTLARIICDNSEITRSQPLVMRRVGEGNPRKECQLLPSPLMDLWKEGQI